MALPPDFVTREIPRICRGFFLVDRADQTGEMPCLTATGPIRNTPAWERSWARRAFMSPEQTGGRRMDQQQQV